MSSLTVLKSSTNFGCVHSTFSLIGNGKPSLYLKNFVLYLVLLNNKNLLYPILMYVPLKGIKPFQSKSNATISEVSVLLIDTMNTGILNLKRFKPFSIGSNSALPIVL